MSDDSQGIHELPEDIQALLDSAAEIEPLPSHLSGRIWSRLEASVGGLPPLDASGLDGVTPANVGGGDASSVASAASQVGQGAATQGASLVSAAGASSSATFSISKLAAVIWTASTFAVGTIAGAGTHAALSDPTEPAMVKPSAPVLPSQESPELAALDMGDVSMEEPDALPDLGEQGSDLGAVLLRDVGEDGVRQAPASRAVTSQREETSPVVTGRSLEAERLLLARAQRALSRGDGEEALDVIRQHERRFGRDSSLAEEREFIRIRALLSTGASDQARSATARFKKRYPGSIFLDALDEVQP